MWKKAERDESDPLVQSWSVEGSSPTPTEPPESVCGKGEMAGPHGREAGGPPPTPTDPPESVCENGEMAGPHGSESGVPPRLSAGLCWVVQEFPFAFPLWTLGEPFTPLHSRPNLRRPGQVTAPATGRHCSS